MTRRARTTKSLTWALLAAIALPLAPHALALDIRVDFGPEAPAPAGKWNTVPVPSSPGGDIAALIDYNTGAETGMSLTVHDELGPMGSIAGNAWTAPPEFPSWIDGNASRDAFFTRSTDHPTGGVTVSGLDDSKLYRVEVIGSRSSSTNRRGEVRINGSFSDGGNSDGYDAYYDGHQDHAVMAWRAVQPTGGQIVLGVQPDVPGQHGYISAMQVCDAQSVLLDLGYTNYQTAGNWNNIHQTAWSGGTGGPGHRVVGAIDAAGQQTALRVGVLDDFYGMNPLGDVSNGAGYPSSAQRDSYVVSTTDPAVFQIEGLTPGQTYDLRFFGSRDNPGQTRSLGLQIGGTTKTLVNSDNTSNLVVFDGVAADQHGHIQIDASVAAGSNGYLGVVEVIGTFSDETAYPSILFDFGLTTRQTGGNWNDLASSNTGTGGTGAANVLNAIDSLGQPTNVDLIVMDDFPGVNTTGEASDDAGFPISAQSDSFYLGHGDDHAELRLEDLVPANIYDIALFGSRRVQDASPVRAIEFTINGDTLLLDNYGNTSNVAWFRNVQPDASGNILIEFDRPSNASFGYFGAMSVTYVAPEPGTLLLLGAGLLGLLRRRKR